MNVIKDLDKFEPLTKHALETEVQKYTREFQELFSQLDGVDVKQKVLWSQIYNNALFDRKNAYIAFADLYSKVHGSEDKHALQGQNIVKYLERMEKSNTQIIKVAELIQEHLKNYQPPVEEGDENEQPSSPGKTKSSNNLFKLIKDKNV